MNNLQHLETYFVINFQNDGILELRYIKSVILPVIAMINIKETNKIKEAKKYPSRKAAEDETNILIPELKKGSKVNLFIDEVELSIKIKAL